MTPIIDSIAPGDGIHVALDALCAKHGLQAGRVTLCGALSHADLVAAPDAPPVALAGPLAVQASVRVGADQLAVWGVVSWSDHGLPRMAAGRIEDAMSAGVEVVLEPWAAAGQATAQAPRAAPSPRRKPKPKSKPKPEEVHVDLSAELAELEVGPAAEPPAAPPATSGWGAAVQASKKVSKPATASDLGFDVDGPPDLKPSDVLLHPRFGRCRVAKVLGRGKVKLRRPTGAFFDLKMSVCAFSRQSDEDGKRVFRLTIKR